MTTTFKVQRRERSYGPFGANQTLTFDTYVAALDAVLDHAKDIGGTLSQTGLNEFTLHDLNDKIETLRIYVVETRDE